MSIDRTATLKRAEKLLQQGHVDGAIQEYVRLVSELPRDWVSINALGDLYVRTSNVDEAVQNFMRVGDYLLDEGFHARAAAVYKKVLKLRPDEDAARLQIVEALLRQQLLADAKLQLLELAEHRRARGDEAAVAECLARLSALNGPDDPQGHPSFVTGDRLAGHSGERDGLFTDPASSSPADSDDTLVLNALDLIDADDIVSAAETISLETSAAGPDAPLDLEEVFDRLRSARSREHGVDAARARLEEASAFERAGCDAEAAAILREIARVPALRFEAAAALGRLCIRRSDVRNGVSWLERAAEAPAPTADAWRALLYDLAELLERHGEQERALAVLLELATDADRYRDVSTRIERLRATVGERHT